MCGIVGIIRNNFAVEKVELETMNNTQVHRGPDGEGYYLDNNIGFGHRRLSIIDIDSGQQPMCTNNNDYWVTYNGELYNYLELKAQLKSKGHVFSTKSDTEVILYAYKEWGKECLNKFRGMFAFAIHDKEKNIVFLARDQFGIKPLVYRVSNDFFAFSSEIKALTKVIGPPLVGSLKSLDIYLTLQYIPAPQTIYKDVYKLPPAHYLIVNEKGNIIEKERYYDISFNPKSKNNSLNWLEKTENAITNSINSQLISDVPFGVFLSGGIDSTLVALKMSKILDKPLKAFTIGFHEKEYSEIKYAEHAAKKMEVELISEIVTENATDILPNLINNHYGEPFGDPSAIPTWFVSRLARKEVTMVLTGDGGDEMFGGYHSYQSWMKDTPNNIINKKLQLKQYSGIPRYLLGTYKAYLKNGKSLNNLSDWINIMAFTKVEFRNQLWRKDVYNNSSNSISSFNAAHLKSNKKDRLSYAQYIDIQTYLPFDILTKVDVSSMANSLETRPPLLDVELAKIVEQLPVHEKNQLHKLEMQGKSILKKILLKDFDNQFVYRKKQGFSIPYDKWFFDDKENGKLFKDLIFNDKSNIYNFFSQEAVKKLWYGYNKNYGDFNYFGTLWLIFIFSLWLEENSNIKFEN
jgi:asparagine synthase (glutamine-hydrolysing)